MDYRPSTIYDTATGGLSLHYGYDTAGQLTELKDGLQSAFLARYDYDHLGRLTVLRDGPSALAIEISRRLNRLAKVLYQYPSGGLSRSGAGNT